MFIFLFCFVDLSAKLKEWPLFLLKPFAPMNLVSFVFFNRVLFKSIVLSYPVKEHELFYLIVCKKMNCFILSCQRTHIVFILSFHRKWIVLSFHVYESGLFYPIRSNHTYLFILSCHKKKKKYELFGSKMTECFILSDQRMYIVLSYQIREYILFYLPLMLFLTFKKISRVLAL